jgi:ricin-type beta-trefoil lectin protein
MKKNAKSLVVIAAALVVLFVGQVQQAHAQSFYFIRNAATGQVLDVPNASTASGTKINQFPLNRGANQQWQINGRCILGALGVVPSVDCDGYVSISNRNSFLMLDVPGASKSSGVQIQQYPFNGGYNQQWLIVPVSANSFKIMNRYSKKYLSVPSPYSAGVTVTQEDANCNAYQVWFFDFADVLF